MRIVFFWLNLGCPVGISVGIGILSRELKDAGNEVKTIHLNEKLGYPYDEARIKREVIGFRPDLFCVSFGGNHINQAKQLTGFLHRIFPSIKIICGGVQTTLTPGEVISWDGVDVVCLSEADGGRLVKFVKSLQQGDGYREMENFWVKEDGRIFKNPIGRLPDISSQARLDFEAFDFSSIIRLNRGFAETLIGRGCPNRCAYCHNADIISLYKSKMSCQFKLSDYCRHRSVDNIIGELKEFRERFTEIKSFMFGDDVMFWFPVKWRMRGPFMCDIQSIGLI